MNIADIRKEQFSSLSNHYFNAAYVGPLPTCARVAVRAAAEHQSNPVFLDFGWMDASENARLAISRLAQCSEDKISLNCSTSEVISTVARGLSLKAGDHIALLHGEYPSDVLSWLHLAKTRNVTVDFYNPGDLADPRAFVESLHPQTRVVNVSHVCFQSGAMFPVCELGTFLKPREIFFVVDVTQSFGGMPLPKGLLESADVIVGSAYKWLLSPYGTAYGIWSDRAMDGVEQSHAGWLNMPHAPQNLTTFTIEQRKGARKFDRGQAPNMIANAGLVSAFSLLESVGLESIFKHNQELQSHFREIFPHDKFEICSSLWRSNILCLRSSCLSSDALKLELRKSNVDVTVRCGNLRIAFHVFNTHEDVEVLAKTLHHCTR